MAAPIDLPSTTLPNDKNLVLASSLRVLVLQAANGSKISGVADTEDYTTLLRAQRWKSMRWPSTTASTCGTPRPRRPRSTLA